MAQNHNDLRGALFESLEYLVDILARCAFMEERHYHEKQSKICNQENEQAIIQVYMAVLHYAVEVCSIQLSNTGKKEMLEEQLAKAPRRACLASFLEMITCKHQCHLETEARIQSYQSNTNKRTHLDSCSEPMQGQNLTNSVDTTQDGTIDNQPNFSTTARISDNNNTSQSSNDNHP